MFSIYLKYICIKNFYWEQSVKKLYLFVLFVFLGLQCACSANPKAGILHDDNSVMQKTASKPQKTVFLVPKQTKSEYFALMFQELTPYIENALVENNFIPAKESKHADYIAVVDFGTLGSKVITKTYSEPRYRYPLSFYEYDDHIGTGAYFDNGQEYCTKQYQVYPHFLTLACYKQKQQNNAEPIWQTTLILQSLSDDFRASIQPLLVPLSKNIRQAVLWNDTVYYEFTDIK